MQRTGSEETVTVEPGQTGLRLDRALAELTSAGSRSRARDALSTGKVSLNGAPVGPEDAARPVGPGDTLAIAWNRPGTGLARVRGQEAMAAAGVRVLHQDARVLALDKPAGLLTDAASEAQLREEDTLKKRAKAALGGEVFVVHRIDRDTTGVVLMARDGRAAEHLDRQFAQHSPERVYLAVLVGRFPGESGRFRDWMAWDGPQRIQRACRPGAPGAVLAEADWRVVERLDGATLLELRLVSGRRNQIRLHAALAGHPLVGERLYRAPAHPRGPPFPRQALHARRLGVLHPGTGQPLTVEAPLPEDLTALLARLRS